MKKMPAHLPPLPDGAVYLGRGGEFESMNCAVTEGWRFGPGLKSDLHGGWVRSSTLGFTSPEWHYAAPADSEIARLNGCGKPSWESAPEWAEWLAQDASGHWNWYRGDIEKGPYPNFNTKSFHYRDPKRCRSHEFAARGQPNRNWRDTLERRPGKGSVLTFEIDEFTARSAIDEAIKEFKESGELPDLVIPKDAADQIGLSMIVGALCEIGYRVEVDRGVVRGWARE